MFYHAIKICIIGGKKYVYTIIANMINNIATASLTPNFITAGNTLNAR